MAKKTYTPENTALCNSLINAVLSSAPEGVNIKATRKDDKEVHFYIMNAPTELYDWSEYDTATRCVNIAFAIKKNENAAKLWEHLRGVEVQWSKDNNGATIAAPVFIGSPRKSFSPIAKNTTLPRERVNTCDALKFAKGTTAREKSITWGIFHECVKVLNNLQTTCKDHAAIEARSVKDLEALPACVGRGEVESKEGDDAPRAYSFSGFNITCTPSALPCLLVRYCKNMGVKLDLRALPALKVVERWSVTPAVEAVESAPVKRVKIGRILLRLVVALLSVCVSALRLCIAALKLAERGRLVEVSREAVRRCVEVVRRRIFVAYCRPVRGYRRTVVRSVEVVRRRIFVAYCRPLRAVRRCVEAIRWSVARLWERVERCAFVAYARPVRGCRRTVVRSVEVMRWNVARTFEGLARWRGALALRAVRLANIVAFACITCARRLDNIAEGLENM